jgi:hypothetical protein
VDTALPPVLLIGTSERVGSNWALDSLRHTTVQHNEPVRQQLGSAHPLSPLSSDTVTENRQLTPIAAHWSDCFVHGKYVGGRHLIKETNLYFAAAPFLRLFPDSAAVVLSRSPLGIASSFTRGDLWRRWRYDEVYRRIVAMVQEDEHRQWAPLVPDDDPPAMVALVRLITTNATLLAEALAGRDHVHLPYETAVLDHDAAVRPLARLLPEIHALAPRPPARATSAVDSTFTTRMVKDELVVYLAPSIVDLVITETARCVSVVRDVAPADSADLVGRWLAGADLYRREDPSPGHARRARSTRSTTHPPLESEYVPAAPAGVVWRNTLVSNREMCALLNELADTGLANTHEGVHLLVIPMPHERGGRLHFTRGQGWRISPGYENHPAYWVTWIGAAAFALREGARLPTRGELDALTEGARASNTDYRVGDVTPVAEPGLPPGSVHHRVGNLQVWCADGPVEPPWAPVSRYLHGAAWNTPGSREEVTRGRSRTLLGASRGVGVRLVRDRTTGSPRAALDIAERLHSWLSVLGERGRSLSELDQEVVSALSQTDL